MCSEPLVKAVGATIFDSEMLADARVEAGEIVARARAEAEQTLAQARAEAGERLQRSEKELVVLRDLAEARMRELQTDSEAVWEERRELLDDIRAMAARLEQWRMRRPRGCLLAAGRAGGARRAGARSESRS